MHATGLCRSNVRSVWWLSMSHIRTCPSSDPENMCKPSGPNSMPVTAWLCPGSSSESSAPSGCSAVATPAGTTRSLAKIRPSAPPAYSTCSFRSTPTACSAHGIRKVHTVWGAFGVSRWGSPRFLEAAHLPVPRDEESARLVQRAGRHQPVEVPLGAGQARDGQPVVRPRRPRLQRCAAARAVPPPSRPGLGQHVHEVPRVHEALAAPGEQHDPVGEGPELRHLPVVRVPRRQQQARPRLPRVQPPRLPAPHHERPAGRERDALHRLHEEAAVRRGRRAPRDSFMYH